jgi:ATP-binding cassette subfamily B protein
MNHLQPLRKYFWKYRLRLLLGIFFIIVSNYFGILAPQVTGYVFHIVEKQLGGTTLLDATGYDTFLVMPLINWFNSTSVNVIMLCGITILSLALLRGLFMFFMRQTIIVMSRHIEYDQKNEIFKHYLQLDAGFYKKHSTGDLMNRIAEDVSRVRMYTGPAIMYLINLTALISFALFFMSKTNVTLTLYTLAPLPVLVIAIYSVNNIINKKSEKIQSLLSDLTTNAQESYSGIRVIKSFVQERAMIRFFDKNSKEYRKNAISLAKVEGIYFPSISLLIGLSTLLTIMIGGFYVLKVDPSIGINTIVEFVIYINMLTFPVSAIGWTASIIQRAVASQKRINEFLQTKPAISDSSSSKQITLLGNISFKNVSFTYENTGIEAIKDFNLEIRSGEKVAIVGRTGSGKTTVAQLLLRYFDVGKGQLLIEEEDIRHLSLSGLRSQISYVPQDVFLFSDSIAHNISFGNEAVPMEKIIESARLASVLDEINRFPNRFETMVGERGVTLSGGQKQRISIARALVKDPKLVLFDDCLSAIDARTEKEIIGNLYEYLKDRTAIIITHRIFSLFDFDRIVVLNEGRIAEQGKHHELLALGGYYADMYRRQQEETNA